jgi:sterol 24-C-methyltransferase
MATPSLYSVDSNTSRMTTLEKEDKERDAQFNKALHGKSAQARGGISAMRNKNKDAQQLAVDEYFKVRYHTLIRA